MATAISQDVYYNVYYLYMAIALIVGFLVLAWLAYNMVVFRDRPGRRRPADAPQAGVITRERGHVIWIYVMAGAIGAVMFGLAFGTIGAVNIIETPPEHPETVHIEVEGFQFGWIFVYPEGFQTINDLRIPVDRPVVMNVTSRDVWHNFALPDYKVRIDAIPGETTMLWVQATSPAERLPISCVVICGTGHAFMRATLTAMPDEEYRAWVESRTARPDQPPADEAAARTLVFDTDGARVDDPDLPAGAEIRLNVTNGMDEAFRVEIGPEDAPLAEETLEAGAEATLTFTAPDAGEVEVRTYRVATGEQGPAAVMEVR